MTPEHSGIAQVWLPDGKQTAAYHAADLLQEGSYTVEVAHELCMICDGRGYTLELCVPPGEDPTHDKPCWACRGKRWATRLHFEGSPRFQSILNTPNLFEVTK